MKKFFLLFFAIVILTVALFGCGSYNTPDIDFDAVSEAFIKADFLVIGSSAPYRQTSLHAYTNDCYCRDAPRCGCGDEIWIFLHETDSAANTAWRAAILFARGRTFDGVSMTVYREGRLIFYGTPGALAIFAEVRTGG